MHAKPTDVTVTHKDGSVVSARIGVAEIMAVERRWKGEVQTVHRPDGSIETSQLSTPLFESTLYGAWCALGRPGEFDGWVDSIETFDEAAVDADPSLPAPGAGLSASSPPKPGSTSGTGPRTSSRPSRKKSERNGNVTADGTGPTSC